VVTRGGLYLLGVDYKSTFIDRLLNCSPYFIDGISIGLGILGRVPGPNHVFVKSVHKPYRCRGP
jgi:hypothetical protein